MSKVVAKEGIEVYVEPVEKEVGIAIWSKNGVSGMVHVTPQMAEEIASYLLQAAQEIRNEQLPIPTKV